MRFLREGFVFVGSVVIIVACNGKQETEAQGSGAQRQTLLDASACEGRPVPAHSCVGGVPASQCHRVNGEPRWQIDCVPPDPNAPPDLRGVSPCEATTCGAEPAWDAADCVHGFVGTPASCESFDRGACRWTRHCRPKPCSVADGACNVIHRERLGQACFASTSCPAGYACSSVSADLGQIEGPVCVAHPLCDAITCAPGKTCVVLESSPSQIVCETM
jgi:hypothetical protein